MQFGVEEYNQQPDKLAMMESAGPSVKANLFGCCCVVYSLVVFTGCISEGSRSYRASYLGPVVLMVDVKPSVGGPGTEERKPRRDAKARELQ